MKKVILTKDIVLNRVDKTAGLSGSIVVQQDNIGLHKVTLANGNKGVINIGYKANTVTILNWVNDDTGTYWTSEILTPEVTINKPSQITDLAVLLVDTMAVEVSWTSPFGNPPDEITPSERYNIYVSESVITPTTKLTALPVFKQNIIPALPNTLQFATLTGLDPNKRYYVALTSDRMSFGQNRISDTSNVVSFKTYNTVKESESQIIPMRIPIDPKEVYSWRHTYAFDPDKNNSKGNVYLKPSYMVNYSNVIDNEGVPTNTEPFAHGMIASASGSWQSNWYHENYLGIAINLDTKYDLDYFYIYFSANPNGLNLKVLVSEDGANYTLASTFAADYSWTNQWRKLSFSDAIRSTTLKNVKFIRLESSSGTISVKAFIAYGFETSTTVLAGKKHKRNTPTRTFNGAIGTNVLPHADRLEMTPKVASILRWYVEPEWLLSENNNEEGEGLTTAKTENDVTLRWSTHPTFNWDTKAQQVVSRGQQILVCYKDTPRYLRSDTDPDGAINREPDKRMDKPLDPGLSTVQFSNTLNPMNYKHYARIAYNMAARFGSTVIEDTQYIQLADGEPIKTGLNLIHHWEFGNEHDRHWHGMRGYNTPFEWAAKTSAAYDGHKGLMGAGFGIKQADPNAIMVQGAMVGMNLAYFKEMVKWWDVNRGKGDYPVQAINIHHYNSWKASPSVQTYSDAAADEMYAICPEYGEYREGIKALDVWRKENAPNMQLWLTEVGYDEHLNGRYAPNYTGQYERETYKAIWILRTFLIGVADGIDVITQYMFSNTVFDYMAKPNQSQRETFYSTGYVNWYSNPIRLTSYYFVSAFRSAMEGYTFSHWIKDGGVNKTTTDIISSSYAEIYAQAFTHSDGSKLIVAWLGGDGLKTHSTKIRVMDNESVITRMDVNDIWTTKQEVANVSNVPSQTDINGKYIDVLLTEYPTIYKTNNTGAIKLKGPTDVKIEVISTSTLKVVWTDTNIGQNKTKIFQSMQPDSGFEIVSNEYQDTASVIISGLEQSTTYYFKLQFENGAELSSVTNVIGATTLTTVDVPTNFAQTEINTTALTIGWNYVEGADVTNFEVYKSSTVDGIYTLVGNLAVSIKSYRDTGLIPETTYYYKVRAVSPFGKSEFTLVLAVTTNEASMQPPQLLSAVTDYSGTIALLKFDLPIANPVGNEAYLTVIQSVSGTPVLTNVVLIESVPNDDTKLRVKFDKVIDKNAIVTFSYNADQGSISSVFGVKIESISAESITNKVGNSTLISRLFKVNITPQSAAYNLNGWTDLGYNPSINYGTQLGGKLKTTEGNLTAVELHSATSYKNWFIGSDPAYSTTQAAVALPIETLPIEAYFPRQVLTSGVSILNKNANSNEYKWTPIHFLNLDASKLYDIRIAVNKTYTVNAGVRTIEVAPESNPEQITTFKSSSTDADDLGFVMKRVKPVVQTVAVGTNTGDYKPDALNAPSICLLMRANGTSTDKAFLFSGFILEEYTDADIIAPIIQSVIINDEHKNQIILTYNEPLSGGLSVSDFTISGKTITDLSVVNNQIIITVATDFIEDEVVILSGGNNKIKDLDNNIAVNLMNRAVLNYVGKTDFVAPILLSATVENAHPDRIILTFDEPIVTTGFTTSDFTTSGKTISTVTCTGSTVTVTVNTPYIYGNTIFLSGGNGKIKNADGNIAADLVNQVVDNNVEEVGLPVGISRIEFTGNGTTGIVKTGANVWRPSVYDNGQPAQPQFGTRFGLGDKKLPAGVNGWVQFTINSILDKYAAIGFKTTPFVGQRNTMMSSINGGVANISAQWHNVLSSMNSGVNNQNTTLDFPAPYPVLMRMERVGAVIYIKYSLDNGTTWTTQRSWPSLSGSTQDLYIVLDMAHNGQLTDLIGYNLVNA